ncbi:MAG: YqaE/Pmp3 family membrane protein [Planctomycetaceae bacterium]|nr:YqaE/Pmp3 family membrane protein [Planctomycetaceae bacterium]
MSTTPAKSTATKGDILRILCAFFLPPLGVFLQVGFGLHFWLNLFLTLAFWVPGMIHPLYIILSR